MVSELSGWLVNSQDGSSTVRRVTFTVKMDMIARTSLFHRFTVTVGLVQISVLLVYY